MISGPNLDHSSFLFWPCSSLHSISSFGLNTAWNDGTGAFPPVCQIRKQESHSDTACKPRTNQTNKNWPTFLMFIWPTSCMEWWDFGNALLFASNRPSSNVFAVTTVNMVCKFQELWIKHLCVTGKTAALSCAAPNKVLSVNQFNWVHVGFNPNCPKQGSGNQFLEVSRGGDCGLTVRTMISGLTWNSKFYVYKRRRPGQTLL